MSTASSTTWPTKGRSTASGSSARTARSSISTYAPEVGHAEDRKRRLACSATKASGRSNRFQETSGPGRSKARTASRCSAAWKSSATSRPATTPPVITIRRRRPCSACSTSTIRSTTSTASCAPACSGLPASPSASSVSRRCWSASSCTGWSTCRCAISKPGRNGSPPAIWISRSRCAAATNSASSPRRSTP